MVSSKSSSIQVLHQQIRVGGGGSDSALAREGGVKNFEKHAEAILEHFLLMHNI